VLASVLPGVRELRAPLVAGYLWLLLLWLVVGGRFPSADESKPVALDRLYDLASVISAIGLAAAASIAAYLLGSLAVEAQSGVRRLIDASRESKTLGMARDEARAREIAMVRLLDVSPALHSEVDRPAAEATFRAAIAPPLAALSIYAAVVITPICVVGVVLAGLLAAQAFLFNEKAGRAFQTATQARDELKVYGRPES
jgi:hypothetical protein